MLIQLVLTVVAGVGANLLSDLIRKWLDGKK